MMPLLNKIFSAAARVFLLFTISAFSLSAYGESGWPEKRVEIYVGYPAGTGIDNVARYYAQKLQDATGKPFVVINKPGAYGNLAAAEVIRAEGDGHTLLIAANNTFTVNPHLWTTMPFDAEQDISLITSLSKWGAVLLVKPDLAPDDSWDSLINTLKAKDNVNYASGNFLGNASGELFLKYTGIEAEHVPYRGVPAAITDLIAGRVDFMFSDVVAGLPHAKSGQLKAYGVTSEERAPGASDIPTLEELGMEPFQLEAWFAVAAPKNIDDKTKATIAAHFNSVTESDDAGSFFHDIGAQAFPNSPDTLLEHAEQESQFWKNLIDDLNIPKID